MKLSKALIVDDESDILELISMTLEKMGIQCDAVGNFQDAKKSLAEKKYHICLTDMRLPDGNGMELVEYVTRRCPNTPIAVITAYGSVELAVNALKMGAFDFVSKPVNLRVLRSLVETALALSKNEKSDTLKPDRRLIGKSPQVEELRKMIEKLSRSQAPILITGSSGTGKELVARLIHEQGPRSQAPFVPVNCGAIPAELMESEFFGYMKGSFTGAHADKQGLFQAANKGTLFLDEIGELTPAMQVKLLRVIQEKAIRILGSQTEVPVDVRILSATHKNLTELVGLRQFREDLYYRINVIELPVPDLKERSMDIPLLIEFFLEKLCAAMEINTPKISKEAMEILKNYSFPGNIRELENILERALTLCEHDIITPDLLNMQKNSEDDGKYLGNYLEEIEKNTIQKVLRENKGDRKLTAEQLGISARALRYRLKKLGINDGE